MRIKSDDYCILRLLELGSFERRPRGWRFGTKTIQDHVVARLITGGSARIEDGRVVGIIRPGQRPRRRQL